MTCEVAVMNKWGIALAADSAVTLGNGRKIFHGAQKLSLSGDIPVGILTYGNAEIMGTPWEIVIKMYIRQNSGRRFDRLDLYAADFLRFLETSQTFFPDELQRDWLVSMATAYWERQVLSKLKDIKRQPLATLKQVLKADHAIWGKYAAMDHLGAGYCQRVIQENRTALVDAAKKVFKGLELGDSLIDGLLQTVQLSCSKQWVHPADRSGIVFAGIGDAERFPRLLDYTVGPLVSGRARYFECGRADVAHESSAIVVPLAQREVMDGFIMGVHPDLRDRLPSIMRSAIKELLPETAGPEITKALESDRFEELFNEKLIDQINEKFRGPLMGAVDALPRQDLATMAEALVNLTVFKARITADEVESVGGPIDVGLISKGDGFVWVKRKA